MKIHKFNNETITIGTEYAFYYQTPTNQNNLEPKYPLFIGKLNFPRISPKNTEILWPSHLKISHNLEKSQIIALRIKAPGFPTADSGPYFRILISDEKNITANTIELIYDSAKGFLLRQIVFFKYRKFIYKNREKKIDLV